MTQEFEKSGNSDAPYFVSIIPLEYDHFLRQNGMPEDQIQALKVYTRRKRLPGLAGLADAVYEPNRRAVVLCTDHIYSSYQGYLKAAEEIAQGQRQPFRVKIGGKVFYEKNPFGDILYTKRLVNYLQAAPSERGMAFARKVILNGVSRELNANFLHETRHAIDNIDGVNKFMQGMALAGLLVGNGMGFELGQRLGLPLVIQAGLALVYAGLLTLTGASVGYYIAPEEIRARDFEAHFKNHPRWREIVEFHLR